MGALDNEGAVRSDVRNPPSLLKGESAEGVGACSGALLSRSRTYVWCPAVFRSLCRCCVGGWVVDQLQATRPFKLSFVAHPHEVWNGNKRSVVKNIQRVLQQNYKNRIVTIHLDFSLKFLFTSLLYAAVAWVCT